MTVIKVLLVVVELICCLLLIGVILLQRSKGQGMGLAFGGAMGESLFGAHAGNVLTKTTVILAIVFLVNTTLLAMLGSVSSRRSSVTDSMSGTPVPAPVAPAGPTDLPAAPAGDLPTVPAPAE